MTIAISPMAISPILLPITAASHDDMHDPASFSTLGGLRKERSKSPPYIRKRRKIARRVTFSADSGNTVHEIPSRSDYSPEDRLRCYLSKADHRRMQTEILILIRSTFEAEGPSLDSDDELLRGLECFAPSYQVTKMKTKLGVHRVLARQRLRTFLNQDWIPELYLKLGQESAKIAYNRALDDQIKSSGTSPAPQRMDR